MKYIIYCISIIVVAVCAFILGKTQAEDKPAMIRFKTDKIGIDSVDRDRSPEGCVLETIGLIEDIEGKQGR